MFVREKGNTRTKRSAAEVTRLRQQRERLVFQSVETKICYKLCKK